MTNSSVEKVRYRNFDKSLFCSNDSFVISSRLSFRKISLVWEIPEDIEITIIMKQSSLFISIFANLLYQYQIYCY